MRSLIKVVGNAILVVGGFFVVLFGTSKVSNQNHYGGSPADTNGVGVAHADAPAPGDSAGGGGSAGG